MDIDRREFLKQASVGAGLCMLPRGASASTHTGNEKLSVAVVGLRHGAGHITNAQANGHPVVALCDVNQRRLDAVTQLAPAARQFTDFRNMLDEMDRQIDAVMIAVPHHTLTTIATAALLRNKHVYCEKPLCHDVNEARVIRRIASTQKGLVTRMGNQGMASNSFRRVLELVQQGAIGEIREAHVWAVVDGPQIQVRPTEEADPPKHINWDVFLGPAPDRFYDPVYFVSWRSWRDYGAGWLGTGGSHAIHMAFRSLDVGALWQNPQVPTPRIRVEVDVSEISRDHYPAWESVRFEIPQRGSLPAATIHWHVGNEEVLKQQGILQHLEKTAGQPLVWSSGWIPSSGSLLIGSKGMVHTNMHNSRAEILPKEDFPQQDALPQTYPALAHDSTQEEQAKNAFIEWVNGCRNGRQPLSNIVGASTASELLMLGNVATGLGQTLEYDPVVGRITNNEEANRAIHPQRREGWELPDMA